MVETRKSFHWAWIILATCFLDLFINYSIRLGYSVALPEMIRDLGYTRTAGGSIYNVYLFTYILLTPVAGFLTDRLGARRVITTCMFFVGLGAVLMGTAGGLWTACLFYAVTAVGASGMWTPVITVVQRWFAPNRRGLALGILSSGYGLGFAAIGIAFPWIVTHFSWRHSWYFLGVGALAMVAVNGFLLRSNPESAGYLPWGNQKSSPTNPALRSALPPIGNSSRNHSLGGLLNNRTFWLIGFSYTCIAYSLYGVTTFMVDYARYQIGAPLEKASLLATLHGVCQVVGVITVVPLSDYLGRKITLVISNAFIMACLTGIVLSGDSWGTLLVLVGVLGVFYGVTWPLYGACAGDYFPKEVMGTVIGAWTPFYGLGAIAVHWVSGFLRDSTGRYTEAFF